MMHRVFRLPLLAALALPVLGCTGELHPTGLFNYVGAFPEQVLGGGSLFMAVDTNYYTASDTVEYHSIHKDGVEFDLYAGGSSVRIPARSVFSVRPSPSSVAAEQYPGAYVTLAVIDLPADPCAGVYPCPAEIHMVAAGIATLRFGKVEIIGTGGIPADLGLGFDATGVLEDDLEPRPLVRLRGIHITGDLDGFDGVSSIGGIQFDLRFPSACFAPDSLRAHAATEAAGATAIVGPERIEGSDTVVTVVLVHPDGFVLPRTLPATQFVGGGPFLDIAFDWIGGGSCSPLASVRDDFTIEGLIVSDTDGAVLIDRRAEVPDDSGDMIAMIVLDASI